ncbi:lipase [Auraticoccus sp. F435]|uniref:Lipase n=1 Tax=Auraticoccus cholistanensis TaxID=2656650 RepID=A0A6A9UWW6_9ACTN|nr:lipase [Auraticoccus cholistanensis]MVA76145.1 lipase [Auraticoccus cholistanensis]
MTSSYPHAVRRASLASALAVSVLLTAVSTLPGLVARSSASGPGDPVAFGLPTPTGPERPGTLELHLVDRQRTDPWAEDGGPRELMISIWYPAVHEPGAPATPYLPERVASFYDQTSAELGIARGAVDFAGAVSSAQTRAPVAGTTPRPVVLYSPGGGMSRALGTILVEELVSHGYVVVTVDSTYQAPVELPSGLTLPARGVDLEQALAERVRDLRFVLDQLELLVAGGNPDQQRRPLPTGLRTVLDLDRVGVFGHSMGGFAAAEAMQADPRLDAGVNLDGSMGQEYQADPDGRIDRPFLLVGAGTDGDSGRPHTHRDAPDWADYWARMTGWRRDLHLPDGEHMSFTDLQHVLPAVGREVDLDEEAVRAAIGTVDPEQSLTVQRTYLRAFFDHHLRDEPQPVLDAVPASLPVAELVP